MSKETTDKDLGSSLKSLGLGLIGCGCLMCLVPFFMLIGLVLLGAMTQ